MSVLKYILMKETELDDYEMSFDPPKPKSVIKKTVDLGAKVASKSYDMYKKNKKKRQDKKKSQEIYQRQVDIDKNRDAIAQNMKFGDSCKDVTDNLRRILCYKNKYLSEINYLNGELKKCKDKNCKSEINAVIEKHKEVILQINKDIQQEYVYDIKLNKTHSNVPDDYFDVSNY